MGAVLTNSPELVTEQEGSRGGSEAGPPCRKVGHGSHSRCVPSTWGWDAQNLRVRLKQLFVAQNSRNSTSEVCKRRFHGKEQLTPLPIPQPARGCPERMPLPTYSPTKVCLVKAMVFPIVMYRCEGEVAQPCPTLCDPVDCSLPGFSIHGILQARILEWVTISFSRGSSPKMLSWIKHKLESK